MATQVLGAAALIGASRVSNSTWGRARRISLESAAAQLGTSIPDLMLTAHRMRVGMRIVADEQTDTPQHFFSERAFNRLEAKYANQTT